MTMEHQSIIHVDKDKSAEYVQNKLLEEGVAVSKEDINKVIDVYYDYLETIGL